MARVRRTAAPAVQGVPAELGDQLHPVWRDADALAAHPVLGQYVDDGDRARLAMGARIYHTLGRRVALAYGFESQKHPGDVDWRAVRAAFGQE